MLMLFVDRIQRLESNEGCRLWCSCSRALRVPTVTQRGVWGAPPASDPHDMLCASRQAKLGDTNRLPAETWPSAETFCAQLSHDYMCVRCMFDLGCTSFSCMACR